MFFYSFIRRLIPSFFFSLLFHKIKNWVIMYSISGNMMMLLFFIQLSLSLSLTFCCLYWRFWIYLNKFKIQFLKVSAVIWIKNLTSDINSNKLMLGNPSLSYLFVCWHYYTNMKCMYQFKRKSYFFKKT